MLYYLLKYLQKDKLNYKNLLLIKEKLNILKKSKILII